MSDAAPFADAVVLAAGTSTRMGDADRLLLPVGGRPESMRRVVDGRIVQIPDRTDLHRAQTPHGARRALLTRAYESQDPRGRTTFIDETTLVQSAGPRVLTVPGEPENLKVTLPGDETLALALLEARARS